MATFLGTSVDDTITGTADADKIRAGAGNDTVHGGAGNDAINGEAGDDLIEGGLGDDTLTGDAGRDTLYGGDGNDGFFGGGDDDRIFGGAGNDTIFGDGANDVIDGGMGADKLNGGTGNDTFVVRAGEGADIITGGSGTDTVELHLAAANVNAALRADIVAYQDYMAQQLASAGSIAALSAQTTGASFTFASLGLTISGTEALAVRLDGNVVALADLLNAAPTAAAVLSQTITEDVEFAGQIAASDADGDVLSYAVAQGPANGALVLDPVSGQYIYRASANYSGPDAFTVIVTDPSGESVTQRVEFNIQPLADAPILSAANASGKVGGQAAGTSGDDVLTGSSGADAISGGAGNDRIYGDGARTVTVALAIEASLADRDGSETLSVRVQGVPLGAQLSAGNDNGDGSWTLAAADLRGLSITASGAADFTLDVVATATESNGSTSVISSVLAVTLDQGGDGDTLSDGSGTDQVYGGLGNDTLIAGLGNDLYDGGDGFDTLDMSASAAGVNVDLSKSKATGLGTDQVVNIEAVIGSIYNDVIDGNQADNLLVGGEGHDTLLGDAGHDRLDGGNGNDILDGGSGDDVLFDGNGNDTVAGGSGNDIFFAGAGNDKYVGGSGFDVLDYSAAENAVKVDASQKSVTGNGNDKVDGVEKFVGTAFDDAFKGGKTANIFDGGAGNDSFRGMGGADVYTGGEGDDAFLWFVKDVLSGNQTLGNDVITDFGDGHDTLNLREFTKAYRGADINDVVHINDGAAGSMVSVKTSAGFIDLVMLQNVHDLTVSGLVSDGMMLV